MSEKLAIEAETDHVDTMAQQTGVLSSGSDDAGLQHVPSYSREGEELDPGYWRSPRFLGSILAIALLANSLFVGYSMPINILSIIDADIGPSPNIYLVSLSFTLVSGVLLLIIGSLSDIIGRRWFIIVAQTFGLVGSVVCATAKNVNTLIAGTVLTAVAGAAQQLYPLLVQELVPNKYRVWAQAFIMATVVPTIGFGTLFARAFVANTALAWRWCYWLNVIVCGISILLFAFCYFPPDFQTINKNLTKMEEIKRIDYGGLFLYSAGLILLLLGFTYGEGTYPWNSAHTLATLIIGAVLVVAFIIYEIYVPLRQPLVPIRIFKIRNVNAAIVIGCVGQMVYYALNLLWPTIITTFFTTDNIKIGLISSTTGTSLAFGEIVIAPFFKRIGHLRWQLVFAAVVITIATALMSIVGSASKEAAAIVLTLIAGCCVGVIEAITITVVGLVVPPEDIGVTMGFYASIRAITGTIALSIYVSVYSARLPVFLDRDITSFATAAGLPTSSVSDLLAAVSNGTTAALEAVPGMTSTILGAVSEGTLAGYHDTFKVVFLATLAFGGLAIISAFFIQEIGHLLNNFVNKTLTNTSKRPDAEK
ncbi:hypothetical protein SEUCBS139899_003317 [Sporothrix eucalyptigena]